MLTAATGYATANIVFLGPPAIGKDGADLNSGIDDADREQCVLDAATNDEVVSPSPTTVQTIRAKRTANWVDSTAVVDALESRAKLVVRTGAADDTIANFGAVTAIIDRWHPNPREMETTMNTVTIYALLEDGDGKPPDRQRG